MVAGSEAQQYAVSRGSRLLFTISLHGAIQNGGQAVSPTGEIQAGDCLFNAGFRYRLDYKRAGADGIFRGVIVSLMCSTRGIVVIMMFRKRGFGIVDGWAWNTLLRIQN